MAHLPKHSRPCPPVVMRQGTVALEWTIRIIAIGVCPASHSHDTSNVALAKQPHTQQLTVNVGPVGRGDIDWKHAVRLVAAVATGGSECGCASRCPQAGYVSAHRVISCCAPIGCISSEADINHRAGFYTPFCNGPGDVKSPQVIIASPNSRFCPWSKLRPPHCAVRGSGESI